MGSSSRPIAAWLGTRLIDAWLIEFQDEFGEFDEDALKQLAADAGVPYLPPDPRSRVA